MTWDQVNISTISGIIVATFMIIEVLKRLFCKNVGFGKIPVWILTIGIAEILVILANKVFKTGGQPILSGELVTVMWRGFLAAASSGGFYSWLKNPEPVGTATPLSTVSKAKTLIVAAMLLPVLSGCGASSLQKAYAAQSLYNDSLQTLISLRQLGVIDDRAYKTIEPVRSDTFAAIQAYKKAIVDGETLSLQSYESTMNKELDILLYWIAKTQAKK